MLQNFPLLQKTLGTGLRSYLVELKEFVEGQAVQDMEQPGGWTQEMTDLVETFYHEGQDVNNITFTIKTHESYAAALAEMQGVEEMDGVDLYIQKLHLDMDSKPVQKPFGWTDEMTGTVMDELRANADTEITYLEEILDAMHGLRIGGLKRYLARVKRDFVAERDHRIQSA